MKKRILSAVALIISLVMLLTSCAESAPTIAISDDGYWVINDEKTEHKAVGEKGDPGIQGEKGDKGDTGEKGDKGDKGADGVTPTIEISEDGYWVINGVKTDVKATGSGSVDETTNADLCFELRYDGTYEVSASYKNNAMSITIPATYNGAPVTSIADEGFAYCTNLRSLTVPASITEIGYEAFIGSDNIEEVHYLGTIADWCKIFHWGYVESTPLTAVSKFYLGDDLFKYAVVPIPEDVTKINDFAFAGCTAITEVILHDNITSIGYYSFAACTSLIGCRIPESVKEINDFAFTACVSMEDVVLSDGLEYIGAGAFALCSGLTDVAIPDSVEEIGFAAFAGCYGLERISIPFVGESRNSHEYTGFGYFGYIFGAETVYENSTYIPMDLSEVIITGGNTIPEYAFYDCYPIKNITIPTSVTVIGNSAFELCEIEKLTYLGTDEQWALIKIGSGNSAIDPSSAKFTPFYGFDADVLGNRFEIDNLPGNQPVGGQGLVNMQSFTKIEIGDYGILNLSGEAMKLDKTNRMNYYHALKTVQDPDDPDNLVLMITATNTPAFQFKKTNYETFDKIGFAYSENPAITIEMRVGSYNGTPINTGKFYFRQRNPASGVSYLDLSVFKITNNVIVLGEDTNVATIPSDRMVKIAFTIDCVTANILVYMENESGEMEKMYEGPIPLNPNFYSYHYSLIDFFAYNTLEPTWVLGYGDKTDPALEAATVEVNGNILPTKNSNGSFNALAVKAYAENNCSFLMDYVSLTSGMSYE